MNWREPSSVRQMYAPRHSRALREAVDAEADVPPMDLMPRAYDGVAPGEVEALLRVERSA